MNIFYKHFMGKYEWASKLLNDSYKNVFQYIEVYNI